MKERERIERCDKLVRKRRREKNNNNNKKWYMKIEQLI